MMRDLPLYSLAEASVLMASACWLLISPPLYDFALIAASLLQ